MTGGQAIEPLDASGSAGDACFYAAEAPPPDSFGPIEKLCI
jgi:hypothetical protein